jgi:hypothetical protein
MTRPKWYYETSRKTAEAVRGACAHSFTPLKRGVNEREFVEVTVGEA